MIEYEYDTVTLVALLLAAPLFSISIVIVLFISLCCTLRPGFILLNADIIFIAEYLSALMQSKFASMADISATSSMLYFLTLLSDSASDFASTVTRALYFFVPDCTPDI